MIPATIIIVALLTWYVLDDLHKPEYVGRHWKPEVLR